SLEGTRGTGNLQVDHRGRTKGGLERYQRGIRGREYQYDVRGGIEAAQFPGRDGSQPAGAGPGGKRHYLGTDHRDAESAAAELPSQEAQGFAADLEAAPGRVGPCVKDHVRAAPLVGFVARVIRLLVRAQVEVLGRQPPLTQAPSQPRAGRNVCVAQEVAV